MSKDKKENKEIREKLEKCEKERDEYLNGWKRAKADFQNYKKEETERFESYLKRNQEAFIEELVSVLDSFNLGLLSSKDETIEKKGVEMIKNQLLNLLEKHGLERIEVETGEKFNPQLHEAVERVESEEPSDKILEEIEKGYLFKGKILRPSKVKVSK